MIKLRLSGVVGHDITADDVSNFLDANDDKDVTIFLNSPGGYVIDGLEIYNLLRASGRNITTVLTGMAASMGSILFLAGDKRIAMTGTMYMIHKPSGIVWGDADDFRKEADLLDKMQGNLQKIYEERASIENLETLMNEESWFDVEEMKKYGVVNSDETISFDGVVDPNNEENEDNETVIVLESEEEMSIEELKAEKAKLEAELEEARLAKEVADMKAELESLTPEETVEVEEPTPDPKEPEPTPDPAPGPKNEPETTEEEEEEVVDTVETVLTESNSKIPAFMQTTSKY